MSTSSLTLTSAQLLAQRSAADHLASAAVNRNADPNSKNVDDGLTSARALALLAAQSAAQDTASTTSAQDVPRKPRQVTLTDETDDDDDDDDDEGSAVSDISSRTPASQDTRRTNGSLPSSLRSSLSGTNLSGTKRPSSDSLSVTGYMKNMLRTDSVDGSLSRNSTANTAPNNVPVLSGSTGLSLSRSKLSSSSRSIKRSRNSLRSFNSSLNTVGEHSTSVQANQEWTSVPLNDAPGGTSTTAGTGKGVPQASSSLGLRRQPSSRSMLAGSMPSRSGLQNSHHMSFNNHHNHRQAGLVSSASRSSMPSSMTHAASMANLAAGSATAPRPNNPFLGGGQTSAAANFLSLMSGGGVGVGSEGPVSLATRMPLPPSSTSTSSSPTSSAASGLSTAQQGMPQPSSSGREPSSLSAAGMPMPMPSVPGMSSATQEFLSLLQQPSGIGSVQALIRSQQAQPMQSQSQRAGEQEQVVRKVQSFVGTCRGSTPPKAAGASVSKTGVAPLKVADDGAVLHNGQTAAAAHAAQTASSSNDVTDTNNSTEESEVSPQQLLMTTIRERTPEGTSPPTIRPVLSIENKFHEHTPDEIAAYLPTAMLVRNNDLPGLKMAHKGSSGSTTLQTSNKFGESLLHIACRRGYDDIARYLLDEAGVTPWVRDDYGRTPCHDACWTATPNLELMDLLVRRCPEMLLMSDKRGSTPLDYVRKDNWDVWRQFLSERWDVICPRVGASESDKS